VRGREERGDSIFLEVMRFLRKNNIVTIEEW